MSVPCVHRRVPGSVYVASGYQMIRSIDIQNFRCYRALRIARCARLNVIVGDNGSGKTSLLEAIFLPLATTTEVALRYRGQRGIDGSLSGPSHRIAEAIWGDFFHQYLFQKPIILSLIGDGAENRSLVISRGRPEQSLPLSSDSPVPAALSAPVTFTWTDASGKEYSVTPKVVQGGLQMPGTGEDMPDFFYFASSQPISSLESATRFSELSKARRERQFVELFTEEYDFIEDINVEISAGAPLLYATLRNMKEKVPLANVSGAISRVVAILLTIASRPCSIALVDEIENGIFYKHSASIWRGFLSFMRDFDSQLFVTTHSREWLDMLVVAAGDRVDDIALWRLERGKDGPELVQFDGKTLKAGIEQGAEVRSEKESDEDDPAPSDL